MGRGQEKLKLVERKNERRGGLLQSEELPILCDADAGIVYFSHGGELYKLSNPDSVSEFFQWYHAYKDVESAATSESEKTVTEDRVADLQQLVSRHLKANAMERPNLQQVMELEMRLDLMLYKIKKRKKKLQGASTAEADHESFEGGHSRRGRPTW